LAGKKKNRGRELTAPRNERRENSKAGKSKIQGRKIQNCEGIRI
jgi:hypothetical protein